MGASKPEPINLVILEDEQAHFELMRRIIEMESPSISITHFTEPVSFLDRLEEINPDVIVVDYMMPGMNGLDFLRELNKSGYRHIPVIMMTGQGSESVAIEAIRLGAWDYLVKSVYFFKLLPSTIGEVIRERDVRRSLRESERFNKLLMDCLPHPATLIRSDRIVLATNRYSREMGTQIGEHCRRIFSQSDSTDEGGLNKAETLSEGATKCAFCLAEEALSTGNPTNAPEVRTLDRIWDVWWIPIGNDMLFHYALDITGLKRTEQELNTYRNHLEDLVRVRTAELVKSNERLSLEIKERKWEQDALKMFAYSVAHDLKSPAIGIHGLAKRLHKLYGQKLDEKGRSYCDQILKVSEHIAALVEQINAFIVTKEATPLFEDTSIKDVLRTLKDEFSAQLNSRQIEWIEPETEVEIKADRLSLFRVFRNLIDNSLKYGGERLSKIRIGHEDTQDFHILSVADDGKGLEEADSEKIFKMFHREISSRGIEGAGMGLAIVKEIAGKHSGSVWVEAGAKKGITFYVSISKNLGS